MVSLEVNAHVVNNPTIQQSDFNLARWQPGMADLNQITDLNRNLNQLIFL